MKLMLDTNILLEYIEHRKEYEAVRTILSAIQRGEHSGYISQGSLYTLAYLTERAYKAQGIHKPGLTDKVRNTLLAILNLVEPLGITRSEIMNAIMNKDFSDIEDSLQYQCAKFNQCGILITINIADFSQSDQSTQEILTPSAFVEKYMKIE